MARGAHRVFDRYAEWPQPLADEGRLRLPTIPDGCTHNAHMFYVITETHEERDGLFSHLRAKNTHGVFHYAPLHESPMGEKLGYGGGQLQVTEDLSRRLVRLPSYFELSAEEQQEITAAIFGFFARP